MPRISKKARLLDLLAEDAIAQIFLSEKSEEIDPILDEAIENITVIESFRCSVPRLRVPKSDHWYCSILETYDDDRFRRYLRVTRSDFGKILHYIRDHQGFLETKPKQMPVEKQLAISLYRFGVSGTGASIGNVSALFGVGDGGTVMKVILRVITVLKIRNQQRSTALIIVQNSSCM
jgi:hypothetical protein